jgi:hypothetical protein
MIRYLLRIALTFDLALVMMVAAAVYAGGRKEWSASMRAFDPGDCAQPCWHGIQPGKTTLDQAEAFLRADNRLLVTSSIITGASSRQRVIICWHAPSKSGCATGPADSPDRFVDDLVFDDPNLTLEEAIMLFGEPIGIRLLPRTDTSDAIVYFNGNVEVWIYMIDSAYWSEPRSFAPSMRSSRVIYESPFGAKCRLYPWRGFRPPARDSWKCR